MKNDLLFEFEVNKENHSIRIKREFDAQLSLVWDAYSNPEILIQWWAPKPWTAKSKTMEFREGGRWHYAMCGPNGEEHWGIMKYQKIIPHKQIAGSDAFCDSEETINPDFPQSTWEINFSELNTRTFVEYITYYGNLEQLETTLKMGFKEGITMALNGLDQVLLNLKSR